MSPTDQIRLNSAAGHLQLGDALDAWHELQMIAPQARAQTEVLVVRLAVCRALKMTVSAISFSAAVRAWYRPGAKAESQLAP